DSISKHLAIPFKWWTRSGRAMRSLPPSCTVSAAGGPPHKSLISPIAWARWSPAVVEQFRIGRSLKPKPWKQEWDGWRRHEVELGFVEKHGGGRLGWPAVWVRYCRHFGHY